MDSRIYPFEFTALRREGIEDMTFMDEGHLPVFPASVQLNYTSPTFRMTATLDGRDYFSRLSAHNIPEADFFDEGIAEAYHLSIDRLAKAHDTVSESVVQRYFPQIHTLSLEKAATFRRSARVQLPEPLGQRVQSLVDTLLSRYGGRVVDENPLLTILTDSGIAVQHHTASYGEDLTIVLDETKKQEDLEELRRHIRGTLPEIEIPTDTTHNANVQWRIDLPNIKGGYHLLEEMLREDIEQTTS